MIGVVVLYASLPFNVCLYAPFHLIIIIINRSASHLHVLHIHDNFMTSSFLSFSRICCIRPFRLFNHSFIHPHSCVSCLSHSHTSSSTYLFCSVSGVPHSSSHTHSQLVLPSLHIVSSAHEVFSLVSPVSSLFLILSLPSP